MLQKIILYKIVPINVKETLWNNKAEPLHLITCMYAMWIQKWTQEIPVRAKI